MVNSTTAKSLFRGTRSATAPANRANTFRDIRAADINPTKTGDSVIARIYQPSTTASIWVPIPTKVVEDQTKVKLRYWKTEKG